MLILLWLVPPAVVTLLTMLWALWAGRPRRQRNLRSEAAMERFAAAVSKQHPEAARSRPAVPRERSTGVVVRRSRRSGSVRRAADADTRRPG